MPDVKELYELVTKQSPPDAGALERQRIRQIRTMRNRKVGAFAIAAAIGVAAVAVILGTRQGPEVTDVGTDVTPSPEEVATGFVEAYGALDADRAVSYLASDADVSSFVGWLGEQGGEGPSEEFRLAFSLLAAQGYSHTLESCEERIRSAEVTNLRCTYDFHWLRSDEIGRGPYGGSYVDLIVAEGEIVHASLHFEIGEVGPQMWAPFADWVARTHPDDVAVMYEDETQSLERFTEASIRLWERHTRGYVKYVERQADGQ